MQAATYIALSSQMALHRQMDVVSNNIANSSTPAFKAEHLLFAEYLDQKQPNERVSFVQDFGTARDTKQGALTRTNNSFDIALRGEGYLAVQTPLGTRYTRNGRLQLDAGGQIVTAEGYPVLGDGNSPINIPTDAKDVVIGRDGNVTTSAGTAGRISVLKFADERDLVPASGGLYVTQATPAPATDTEVMQGMIEESNVQPIVEMTRLMTIAQSYNSAKDMLDSENDRAKTAIDKLGQIA